MKIFYPEKNTGLRLLEPWHIKVPFCYTNDRFIICSGIFTEPEVSHKRQSKDRYFDIKNETYKKIPFTLNKGTEIKFKYLSTTTPFNEDEHSRINKNKLIIVNSNQVIGNNIALHVLPEDLRSMEFEEFEIVPDLKSLKMNKNKIFQYIYSKFWKENPEANKKYADLFFIMQKLHNVYKGFSLQELSSGNCEIFYKNRLHNLNYSCTKEIKKSPINSIIREFVSKDKFYNHSMVKIIVVSDSTDTKILSVDFSI